MPQQIFVTVARALHHRPHGVATLALQSARQCSARLPTPLHDLLWQCTLKFPMIYDGRGLQHFRHGLIGTSCCERAGRGRAVLAHGDAHGDASTLFGVAPSRVIMCFIEDGREPLVCSVERAQQLMRLPVLIPLQQIDLDRLFHAQYGGSFGVCGIHLIQTAGVSERTRWWWVLAEHGGLRQRSGGGAERVCHVLPIHATFVVPAVAGWPANRAARLDVMVRVSYLLWYVTLRLNCGFLGDWTTSDPHLLTQIIDTLGPPGEYSLIHS